MTIKEFSDEFSVAFNSYINTFDINNSFVPVNLDEYEKSVFLTMAQEMLISEWYTGKNMLGESLEETEEYRRLLDKLLVTVSLDTPVPNMLGLTDKSVFFNLPEDLMYITYESIDAEDPNMCNNAKKVVTVQPITQDEYHKIKGNPFRGKNLNRALRLEVDRMSELIYDYTITRYLIRYVRKPNPIILVDLTEDNLSINGKSEVSECELDAIAHRVILERAVILAAQSRMPASRANERKRKEEKEEKED